MAKLGQFSGSQVNTNYQAPTTTTSKVNTQPTPTVTPIKKAINTVKSSAKESALALIPGIGPLLAARTIVPKVLNSKPVQAINDLFNIPLYATAGALKSIEAPELKQGLRPNVVREWTTPGVVPRVIEGAKQGLKEKTMLGDVLRAREESGQAQPKTLKAGAFVSDLAFPSLPVAGLLRTAGKASKAIGFTDVAQSGLRPLMNLVKASTEVPAVNKTIEFFSPGYKVPEARKIIEAANEVTNVRVNKLAREIKESAEGLSQAEQMRVGQLMEGGITAIKDSRLAGVAKKMNDLADEIGAQGVALWERSGGNFGLNPESYLKYKGKYMTHIWNEMTEGGKKAVGFINQPGGLSGRFFKLRKGAEGYVKQFAPATFKGLGTQIQDIELGNAYLKIAEKYGIPMEKLQKPEDVVNEAINVLLREHKAPKAGLGPVGFSGQMIDNMSNYLLDVFRKYQPAHRLDQAEETAQGIYTGLANAELTGKTPQALEKWVQRNGAAFQQVFGFTPDESALRAFINQVGELPVKAGKKIQLNVGRTERLLQDGFGYAPEVVRKANVGKLFEDVGLPNEVVDYINMINKAPGHNLWDDAINAWKVGKTILNPAYHFRNIFSNQILAGWAKGKNIFQTSYDSVKAFINYHQGHDAIFKAAEDTGLINAKSMFGHFQEFLNEADLVANKNMLQRYVDWWKNVQHVSEDTAKLNVFTDRVLTIAKASKRTVAEVLADPKVLKAAKDAAEEAIFSPYRISIGERALVKRIIPFYAFTRQALPFYFKTLFQHPERVMPYNRFKPALESQLPNTVPNDLRPDWQKGQTQLPSSVSKALGMKEPLALDTTYLFPHGNYQEDVGASIDKGQLPFGLSVDPFSMEIAQQIFGKDLYFDQEFGQGALPGATAQDILSTNPVRRLSERIDHALMTLAPSLYRTIKGKLYPAFKGVPDYAGRERSKIVAVLDALGLKLSVLRPEDQVKFQSYDQYQLTDQIKSEMRSIARDQSKTPQQRQELLEEYIKELQRVATQQ